MVKQCAPGTSLGDGKLLSRSRLRWAYGRLDAHNCSIYNVCSDWTPQRVASTNDATFEWLSAILRGGVVDPAGELTQLHARCVHKTCTTLCTKTCADCSTLRAALTRDHAQAVTRGSLRSQIPAGPRHHTTSRPQLHCRALRAPSMLVHGLTVLRGHAVYEPTCCASSPTARTFTVTESQCHPELICFPTAAGRTKSRRPHAYAPVSAD